MLRKLADLLKTVALAEIEVEKVRISLSKIISPNLKEIPFELLDERKRGSITSLELSRFFEKHKIETTQDEVRMIIEYYDLKRQGKLSLEDFHKALAPRTKLPQEQKKKEEGKPKRVEDEIVNFFAQELEFIRKTHMLRVHLHGTVASNSFDFYNAINKDQEKAEFTFHDFDDFLQNQGIIFSKEEIQAIMNRGDRDGKHEVSYVEFERYILPDVVNKKVDPRPEPEYMYNTIVENYRVNKAYDKEQIRKDLKQEGLSFHTPFDQYETPSTFSPENPLLFQPIPTSSHTHTGYFNHLDKYHRPTRNHYSSLNDDYKRTKSSYLTGTNILATTYSSTKQRSSYDKPSYNNRPSFERSSYQKPSFERPSYNSSVPTNNNYRSNATVTSNLSSISSKYEKAYSYLTKDRDRFDELSSLSVSAVPSLTSTYEKAYPFATRERPFYVQPYHYKRYPYTTPYYPDQYYQSHRARPKRSQSVPYPHNMYGSNSTAVLGAGYKPYHAERRFETPMKYSDQMGIDHSPEYKRNYSNGKYPISGPQPSSYYKVYDRFPADCYMLTKEADSKFKNEGAPPVTTYNHGEPSFLNTYSSVRSNERSRSAQSFFVKGQNEKLMRESNSFQKSNGFRATDAMKRANAWLNRDHADLARTSKLNVGTGTRTYQPDLARTAKYGSYGNGNSYQPSQRVQDLTRSRRLY